MHNLHTVFRFEVIRTLKKKSFWIIALAFPIIIAAVGAIIFFSNKTTDEAAANTQKQQFSLAVTDESGLISNTTLTQLKAERTNDKQTTISRVLAGKLDAYFYYPKALGSNKVEVYARDVGLFDNGRYEGVAQALLQQAATSKVDPQLISILQSKVSFKSTIYKDGQPFNGFQQLIAPGAFLVLFYILISMFGNQMLTSTTEEKENRVIEMILTTIEARTLIIGKILSLVTLAFVQIVVIVTPIIVVYLLFHNQLSLPNIDLSNIPLDPSRIGIGALLFVFSFLMFTGVLVAIGAASPTAKEASGFFGMTMVLIFGPLYAASLFISTPNALFVKILTFFPLTAPIPLMLRNAVGNLSAPEVILGIVILVVSAVIALSVAIRLFRYGALEYSRRLTLKEIFARKS